MKLSELLDHLEVIQDKSRKDPTVVLLTGAGLRRTMHENFRVYDATDKDHCTVYLMELMEE